MDIVLKVTLVDIKTEHSIYTLINEVRTVIEEDLSAKYEFDGVQVMEEKLN